MLALCGTRRARACTLSGMFVLGIAAAPGPARPPSAERLVAGLAGNPLVVIDHDAYYRDGSAMPAAERLLVNYDHPDAIETELLVAQLADLRAGRAVEIPKYDFKSRARQPRRVA